VEVLGLGLLLGDRLCVEEAVWLAEWLLELLWDATEVTDELRLRVLEAVWLGVRLGVSFVSHMLPWNPVLVQSHKYAFAPASVHGAPLRHGSGAQSSISI
jgi:hypothetical protein